MSINAYGKTCNSAPQPLIVDKIDKEALVSRLQNLGGTAFIIVTEREDGRFEYHDRDNNPCQGGHLRTYGSVHDDCTRPKDDKPHDLWKHFPDGKPVSLMYRIFVGVSYKEQFEAAFSNDSPWVAGFGGEDNRELIPVPKNLVNTHGYQLDKVAYYGVFLKTGNFDPTVFVSLLKNGWTNPTLYAACREKGLSVAESLTFTCFFMNYDGKHVIPRMAQYVFDPMNSINRMVAKSPVNITGGTWGERFAYNRPDLASPFRGRMSMDEKEQKEKDVNIAKIWNDRKLKSLDESISLFKEFTND